MPLVVTSCVLVCDLQRSKNSALLFVGQPNYNFQPVQFFFVWCKEEMSFVRGQTCSMKYDIDFFGVHGVGQIGMMTHTHTAYFASKCISNFFLH